MINRNEITIEEYQGITDAIDEATSSFIWSKMQSMLPKNHVNMATFTNIIEKIAAKTIFPIAKDHDLNHAVDIFCKDVKDLTKGAKEIDSKPQ